MIIAALLAMSVLLASCSSTAERFDKRPAICKDLGKRGGEC